MAPLHLGWARSIPRWQVRVYRDLMKSLSPQRSAFLVMLAMWLATGHVPGAEAIPPPPEQLAADCTTPTYASDVVVCGDPALLAADLEVTQLYESLQEVLQPTAYGGLLDRQALFEPQDAWFRRRSLCAFSSRQPDCLRAAYGERLRILRALGLQREQPSPEVVFAVCRDSPWGLGSTGIRGTQLGEIVLTAPSGWVRAVAVGDLPRDDWTPYLRHQAEGSQLRLFPLEGPVITCELREPN